MAVAPLGPEGIDGAGAFRCSGQNAQPESFYFSVMVTL
jgi:hypothetical protein